MITTATYADLPTAVRLFEEAVNFQEKNNYTGWKNFDINCFRSDIENGLLFKVISADRISGIFSICYTDALIWGDHEKGDALYMHRIIADRRIQQPRLFPRILDWACGFAREKKLQRLRMDTWAENRKLIDYYKSCGFREAGEHTTPDTPSLPVQHRNLHVVLLELAL